MPRPRTLAVLAVFVVAPWWVATMHPPWAVRWRGRLLSRVESPLKVVHTVLTDASAFLRAPALLTENARLRRQLLAVQQAPMHAEESAQEVARLRRLLQLRQAQQRPAVAARVLGRDATSWFRTLLLDAGARDGISEGGAVVVEGGLVGQVVEVGPSVARALLMTDPRFRVAALVQRSRAQGIVLGTARGRCYLSYVTTADGVQVGDVVLTAGVGGVIPKGLVIGQVVRVEPDPSRLYWQAQIQPAVDPTRLEEVLCLS